MKFESKFNIKTKRGRNYMSKRMQTWAYRTVRNGRVKIGKKWYKPRDQTNRFNGQKFAFGRYYNSDDYLPFVYLWGTERYAKNNENEEYMKENISLLTEDDVYKWEWWDVCT